MDFKIGQEIEFSGKTYKIVGTHKRSFVLESNGQKYTATAKKLNAMLEYKPVNYMEQRLKWNLVFDKKAHLPQTEEEFLNWANQIAGDMSPENLHCDGEISAAQAGRKMAELKKEHKELEAMAGYKLELVY